jgi:hypothetical protein
MATMFNGIRKLIKAFTIMVFFLFGLWLLQVVYFPQAVAKRSDRILDRHEGENVFRNILSEKGAIFRGHFHMVDEYVSQPEPNPPLCLTCHGTYPHSKEKKVRSLLNSHAGFLACAVCHVQKDSVQNGFSFAWIDRETGKMSSSATGAYGKYPAKLFPIIVSDGGGESVFRPISKEAAQQYLEVKDKYTPDQVAQAKVKLHSGISKKPVYCTECHKKDGYLPFDQLGFSPNRVQHLVSTEVAGMLEKYDTFYLPSVIDFEFSVQGQLQ